MSKARRKVGRRPLREVENPKQSQRYLRGDFYPLEFLEGLLETAHDNENYQTRARKDLARYSKGDGETSARSFLLDGASLQRLGHRGLRRRHDSTNDTYNSQQEISVSSRISDALDCAESPESSDAASLVFYAQPERVLFEMSSGLDYGRALWSLDSFGASGCIGGGNGARFSSLEDGRWIFPSAASATCFFERLLA